MIGVRFQLPSLFLVLSAASVWSQPVVSRLSSRAVQPGATVDVTLRGERLGDPLQVWTSFPATCELTPVDTKATEVKSRICQVTLDDDVAVGIGGVVLASPAGVSELRYLMIDDLDTVLDEGDNHSIAEAQRVTLPIGIEGVVDGGQPDYYRFHGQQDQRLSVEVMAARLGSELDAVVRLLRADGSELTWADDDLSLGADCRFSWRLPQSCDYLLEIRDNRYRSGGWYRLRVGDFPLVTVPYPLGGRRGTTRRYEFAGRSADPIATQFIRIPEELLGNRLSVASKHVDGLTSAPATLAVSELPEAVEVEPNGCAELATPVTPPVAINGRLQAEGDQDHFEFAALQDQSLRFRALTRSLGSPSIIFLRLSDGQGQQLAASPITDNDEWTLDHRFAADGTYRLRVEDLLRRGGNEHAYRIEVRPPAGFDLTINPEESTRFHPSVGGGAIELTLRCERRGYDGPVELALQTADPSFQLLHRTIPAGGKEHRLIVALSEVATTGSVHPLRLVGRAVSDGSRRTVVVSNAATWRDSQPAVISPPDWLDGLLFAVVGNELSAFFTTQLADPTVVFDHENGQAQVVLVVERTKEEFQAGLTVLVENLPADFTYDVKPEEGNYRITIQGPPGSAQFKDAAGLARVLRVISYGEFGGQGIVYVHPATLELDAENFDSTK